MDKPFKFQFTEACLIHFSLINFAKKNGQKYSVSRSAKVGKFYPITPAAVLQSNDFKEAENTFIPFQILWIFVIFIHFLCAFFLLVYKIKS